MATESSVAVQSSACGWRSWRFGVWNWRYIQDENPEVTGYHLIGGARGAAVAWLSVFSILAITGLAEAAQDCTTQRVELGGGLTLRSTSIVSTVLTAEGIANAVFSPIVGVLADSGSHRTLILRFVTIALGVLLAALAVILFFAGSVVALVLFGLVLVVVALLYELQVVLHSAYLPEISHDETERTAIASKMYGLLYVLEFTFIALAFGISFATGVASDKFAAPQIGVAVALALYVNWGTGAWFFDKRHKDAESRVSAGFLGIPRIASMIKLCWTDYNQLGLYLLASSFYISGATSLIGLVATYILSELGVSGFLFQVLTAIVLFCTIPGAFLVGRLNRWVGSLKKTTLYIVVYWVLVVAIIPLVLVGEEDPTRELDTEADCPLENSTLVQRKPIPFSQIFVFVEAIIWGLSVGAIFTANLALCSELIPGGSESGFFGLRTFAVKIWSWAPPLIYTTLNEATDNPRIAINAMLPFFVTGAVLLYFVDMDKAAAEIEHTLHLRHGHAEKGKKKDSDLANNA